MKEFGGFYLTVPGAHRPEPQDRIAKEVKKHSLRVFDHLLEAVRWQARQVYDARLCWRHCGILTMNLLQHGKST
jgi:hypothetical protein